MVTSQRNEATMPTDLEPISTSSSTTSLPPTRTVALTLRVLLTGMSVVPTAFCWAAAVRSLYWTDGSVTWFWIEMSTFEVGYVRRVISFVRAFIICVLIDSVQQHGFTSLNPLYTYIHPHSITCFLAHALVIASETSATPNALVNAHYISWWVCFFGGRCTSTWGLPGTRVVVVHSVQAGREKKRA